jgi:dihydrofolate synthase/folylpolyglutamate synthase
VAAERGAAVVPALWDVRTDSTHSDGRARLTVRTPIDSYGPIELALRGEHQVTNALIAIRLLEAAKMRGIHVPRAAIEQGLAAAEWPARLEIVPLPRDRRLLIDAAHNVEGAEALAQYLEHWHPERPPLVIGVMADKDVDGILTALLPRVGAVVATQAPGERALPASALAARVTAIDPARRVTVEPDPERALEQAYSAADFACLAGSIYLAGHVRDALNRRAILH